MGVVCYEMEATAATIPPAKIYQAFILDSDTLIPKLLPQAIKSIETIEGDGGPGTTKLVTFGEWSKFKSAKHKIEVVDKENLIYSYSVIEGGELMESLEKITTEMKFVASSDGGGTICKSINKYYTIGDFEFKEEEFKVIKEKAVGMFKAVEAYVLANPEAY